MRNEECVADIDLFRTCQILTLTPHKEFNHCVSSILSERKCNFNEIKQKDVAVYNNSQSFTYCLHIMDQGNVCPRQRVCSTCHTHN